MSLDGIAQQGGFAVLAALCVWAIVAVVKINTAQLERAHLREMEGARISMEMLRTLAADRAELLKQALEIMRDVQSALVSLQDEIGLLREGGAGRKENVRG